MAIFFTMNNEKTSKEKRVTESLTLQFADLPFEGVDIRTNVRFSELNSAPIAGGDSEELAQSFSSPILVEATVIPVAAKVDLRGEFTTLYTGVCDRCTCEVNQDVKGSLTTFLMPQRQFSEHDKPGGKVIHSPTRDTKPSRHHSKSKAPVLADAEGEHEDLNFGAFDGQVVDLRPLIRELLILQLPMRTLCSDSCKGLCMKCGENLNDSKCSCAQGPTLIFQDTTESVPSPLATALQEKLKSH
ncbi:MAG: DUF177 domain-containing protein [Deltaproteobacteria bacterium]|nr:DUF177 domain-containing protein [Deltaproteobacteria bacterium]